MNILFFMFVLFLFISLTQFLHLPYPMSNAHLNGVHCLSLVFLSFLSPTTEIKDREGVFSLSLSFSLRVTDTKPIQRLTNLLQTKNNIESSHSFRIAIFCDGDNFL